MQPKLKEKVPDESNTRFGVGGGSSLLPDRSHIDEEDIPPELFPYGLPAPPKQFSFAGLGWGYGFGCSVGPYFGTGVGFGFPGGVLLGAGAGIGAVCGVGFGAGLIIGSGAAYVPFGYMQSVFFSPKILWAERAIERWRIRNEKRLADKRERRRRRGKAIDYLPAPLQNGFYSVLEKMGLKPQRSTQSSQQESPPSPSSKQPASHSGTESESGLSAESETLLKALRELQLENERLRQKVDTRR